MRDIQTWSQGPLYLNKCMGLKRQWAQTRTQFLSLQASYQIEFREFTVTITSEQDEKEHADEYLQF